MDYSLFIERVDDFDQRLASILCQAFHDCSGCESVFKVHVYTCKSIIACSLRLYLCGYKAVDVTGIFLSAYM